MQVAGFGSPTEFGLLPVVTHAIASSISAWAGKLTWEPIGYDDTNQREDEVHAPPPLFAPLCLVHTTTCACNLCAAPVGL